MSSDGAAVLAQITESMAKLEKVIPAMYSDAESAQRRINEMFSSVPEFLRGFVEWLADMVVAAFKKIWDGIKWLGNWIAENVGPVIFGPITLWRTGTAWSEDVYDKVTTVSGKLTTEKSELEDYWEGPAATQYVHTVRAQKAASEKVAEIVSSLRTSIQDLALSLGAVYIGMAAGLLLAVGFVAGGSAAVASFFGIPPGVVAILAGVLKGIAVVGIGYAGIKELIDGTAQEFATLLELENDNTAFDEGHWPAATSELSDGSMADGDRSKWEYKF